jgi:hypothetical protein
MEIESIPEVESESDGDAVHSHTDLQFNRMSTEFEDDEQEYDLYTIDQLIRKQIIFAGCLVFTLVLVHTALQNWVSSYFSVLPLLLFELKNLADSAIKLYYEAQVLPSLYKSEYFVEILLTIGNILSLFLVLAYLSSSLAYLSISSVPVLLSLCLKFCFHISASSACLSFAFLVPSI